MSDSGQDGIGGIGREFWSDPRVGAALRSLALRHGRGDGLDDVMVAFAAEETARDFVTGRVAEAVRGEHSWSAVAERLGLSRPAVSQRYDPAQREANRQRQIRHQSR